MNSGVAEKVPDRIDRLVYLTAFMLLDGQSVLFNAINRNKRSVSLNLKSEAGRDLLLQLVEGADVLT